MLGSGSLKLRSGCVERGMKCMFEGEGRISRLLRSKSWQNIAEGSELEFGVDCGTILSVTRYHQFLIIDIFF